MAKHAGIIEEEDSYYSGTSRSKDDSKEGGESSEGDRDNHIELDSVYEESSDNSSLVSKTISS